MKRISILVNKDFEYKGFIEGLRDTVQVYAGTNGRDAECRFDNLIADIYCIHNLFSKYENSSHSEMKYDYLKALFKSNFFRIGECDGLLSFSTSESTPYNQTYADSQNGCVYVGNRFFISDQQEKDKTTTSHLRIGNDENGHIEYYKEPSICSGLYDFLNLRKMNFRSAPNNSANILRCVADSGYNSIGVVNVMDYSCYEAADKDAYDKLTKNYYIWPVCIETTHGVVVKAFKDTCSDLKVEKKIPVNFISPIVDRYLKFDEDVDGKYGKQNFICSYNGGVATGHILKYLNDSM